MSWASCDTIWEEREEICFNLLVGKHSCADPLRVRDGANK